MGGRALEVWCLGTHGEAIGARGRSREIALAREDCARDFSEFPCSWGLIEEEWIGFQRVQLKRPKWATFQGQFFSY